MWISTLIRISGGFINDLKWIRLIVERKKSGFQKIKAEGNSRNEY